MGDVIEARAIEKVYGKTPVVTGLKSYMGHTMGSCGAIETILTLYMMEAGFIAPTLNLDTIDDRCAMINHATKLIETDIRIASIQNFAFGGVNTCLMFKRPDF
jgi:3-oxoacyl-[acyl-carrier-protein] synthase II